MPPPDAARLQRALKERIYLLGPAPAPTETSRSFLVSGQSGKVYTTTLHIAPVDSKPTCNCPDQRIRKSVCKHLLFIASRVLKLPNSKLGHPSLTQAQADKFADTSAALQAAGAHAAPAKLRDSVEQVFGAFSSEGVQKVPPRGPEEDEECPVCFERLCAEPVVHCGYGCGRAVHKECFERYVKASDSKRCILCRANWDPPQKKNIGRGGYLVNRRLVDLSESVPELYVDIETVRKRRRDENEDYEVEEEEMEEYDPDYEVGKRKRARKAAAKGNASSSKTRGAKGKAKKVEVENESGKRSVSRGAASSRAGSSAKTGSGAGKKGQGSGMTTRAKNIETVEGSVRAARITRSVTRASARRVSGS